MRTLKNLVLGDSKIQDLRLVVKMALIANLIPSIVTTDIELVERAIEFRNKVIHEGKEPNDSHVEYIEVVLRIVVALLDMPVHKFPSANAGNCLFPLPS
jgi:hypothetical protein